jgi:outer membrane biosynthesis protein TonB
MSELVRCPHCKAELPEKASFCARCGRRIEGWSVPKDATPAMGETALPGGDEATRQMAPTPSLLRAAAISVKKGAGGKPKPRRPSHLPLILAMVIVAVAGGVGGFFVVRARVRRSPSIVTAPPPSPVAPPLVRAPSPPPSATPNPQPPTPNKTLVRKNKAGKRAHVIASPPVAVKARASSSGGLPHKQVATDSKALKMPTVQHETTEAATPPPTVAEDKAEAEAGVDADSVRLVVRQHLPQVRTCYGRAFKDASPGGTVEIGFAIDPAGRAKNVRTETNTTDSEALAHCLEARVREWQFPRPVGGDYELIYPFVFAPGS